MSSDARAIGSHGRVFVVPHFEDDDARVDTIADHLLEQQMPDGGWNCRRPDGATHASVHTTISALEGLRLYELHRGRRVRVVRAAQRRGREFLLVHPPRRAEPLEHSPRAAGAQVVGSRFPPHPPTFAGFPNRPDPRYARLLRVAVMEDLM